MIKSCEICTISFYAKPNRVAIGQGRFCSKKCYDKWQLDSGYHVGSKSPRWNSVKRVCKQCGAVFYRCPAKIALGRGIYCSKECYHKGMVGLNKGVKRSEETIAKLSGKNHYNWKGGRSLINRKRLKNREWDGIKKLVYARDNRMCQKCKKHCGWMDISCHHKVPWRIVHDDNLDNLITLCRSCHAKEDLHRIPTVRDDAVS